MLCFNSQGKEEEEERKENKSCISRASMRSAPVVQRQEAAHARALRRADPMVQHVVEEFGVFEDSKLLVQLVVVGDVLGLFERGPHARRDPPPLVGLVVGAFVEDVGEILGAVLSTRVRVDGERARAPRHRHGAVAREQGGARRSVRHLEQEGRQREAVFRLVHVLSEILERRQQRVLDRPLESRELILDLGKVVAHQLRVQVRLPCPPPCQQAGCRHGTGAYVRVRVWSVGPRMCKRQG
jgi:hypothetical protein